MDRWLPKGNIQSPTDGAFERFLTAAIATIITIIFSWRMLDQINEDKKEDEDEPGRHRLGHFSSVTQSSSFVSFSSSYMEGKAMSLPLAHRQPAGIRPQRFGQHNESLSERVVSLSVSTFTQDLAAGGVGFQENNLNTIGRVPVDLPLCGDNPNNTTSAKISVTGEASGKPCDSDEVFISLFTSDCCASQQLPGCSIDCASPGASLEGGTHSRELEITTNRSGTLSQAAGSFVSHTAWRLGRDSGENNICTSISHRENNSSCSTNQAQCDLDVIDTSLEESGNTGVDNDSDPFIKNKNNYSDNNNTDNYQNIAKDIFQQFRAPDNTTDDRSFENNQDDGFIVSSDSVYHHSHQDYEFDEYDDDVQPRELDSDEELFCCSILEPIIEENSDEMTTSSEGDNSRTEKSLHTYKDAEVARDLDYEDRKRGLISEETIFAGRSNYKVSSPVSFWPETDLHTSSHDREVPQLRSVSDIESRIPDLDRQVAKLKNINTSTAANPDSEQITGTEASSFLSSTGTHSDDVHASFFVPDVPVTCDQEGYASRDEYFKYIQCFGSSVDRISQDFVNEFILKDNASIHSGDDVNQTGKTNTVDNVSDEAVIISDQEEQFATHSFVHTFSTRVEVEDSNSESDESVQTVISRHASRDLGGSPLHGQVLTSGLSPVPENTKRPLSDGFLYSSKKWTDDEEIQAGYRVRNASEGGGVAFLEEVKSRGKATDILPGRGHLHSVAYKSYTTQNLNSLSEKDTNVQFSDRITSTIQQYPKTSSELDNYCIPSSQEQIKYESNNDGLESDLGRRLFDSGEHIEKRDTVDYAKRNINLDSESAFVTSVSADLCEPVTLPPEVSTESIDYLFVNTRLSIDDKENDFVEQIIDQMENPLYDPSRTESRIDGRREDTDEEEWVEETEETFVLPVSLERTVLSTMQNVKDEEDDNDEDWKSSCTTTMIEVEGHGAFGLKGKADVMSGYRDHYNTLAHTDRDFKERLGFRLNLDEYKTDEYVTKSGLPIVRMIEQERVYVNERNSDEVFHQKGINDVRGTRELYEEDNEKQSRPEAWDLAESINKHEKDKEQEVEEDEEIENYVEEKIILGTNYHFKEEKSKYFEPDQRSGTTRQQLAETSVLTTRLSQFLAPSSQQRYSMLSYSSARSPGLKILPVNDRISSDYFYYKAPSEKTSNIWGTQQVQYIPSTQALYTRPEFAQQDIFQSRYPNLGTDEKQEDTFSDIPSRSESVSNYDDFVRLISEKDDKPDGISLSPSPSDVILSGNVTTSQTKEDMFVFATCEPQPTRPLSHSSSKENSDDKKDLTGAKGDTQLEKEDVIQYQDPVLLTKPRFVRTSTAQDEEELMGLKQGTSKLSSGSLYDESASVLNRSFEETSRSNFVLERSNSWLREFTRSTGREDENKPRSRETSVSEDPSLEYRNVPESPRPTVSFVKPLLHSVTDTSPRIDVELQTTLKSPDRSAARISSVQSPSAAVPSITWTRVIPGSFFVEQKLARSSENKPVMLENTVDVPSFGETIKPASNQTNVQDFAEKNKNAESLSPIFSQSDILLSSPPNTAYTSSNLLNTLPSSRAPDLSAGSSPYKFMTTSTMRNLPSVFSSVTKPSLGQIFKTSDEGTQADIADTDQYDTCKLDSTEVANKMAMNKVRAFVDYRNKDDRENEGTNQERREVQNENEHEDAEGNSKYKRTYIKQHSAQIVPYGESISDRFQQNSFSTSEITSSDSSSTLESPSENMQRISTHLSVPSKAPHRDQSHFLSTSSKKPKSMKELKKRYKQPYKSILTEAPTKCPTPKAAPFVVPQHLITPTRLQILQSRNRFLSEQNLHTESFTEEFAAHKEAMTQPALPGKDRKYTPKMSKHPNYRSQEQLQKIMYMVNLKPGGSESSLHLDCLHDDCILSEKGRREILDKTLSIDNLDADLHTCLRKLCSESDNHLNDAYYPETNSDLFDLTFPLQDGLNQQFDRPASMGELRHAADNATVNKSANGIFDTSSSKNQDHTAQRQYIKSKSVCALETNPDEADLEASSIPCVLQRPPSAQELRLSKSLRKLNVPDWYRKSNISKSTSSLHHNKASTNLTWASTSSLVSSPSTTPSVTSNVVIRSRVQFPTSARNLKMPSKSAPVTPSFVDQVGSDSFINSKYVTLPSDKMRTMEKPLALQPIPIVPFEKILAMLDRRQQEEKILKSENEEQLTQQPSASSKARTTNPDTMNPPDLFIVTKSDGDHHVEATPQVIVSPSDPGMKSILKRPNNERTYSNIHKFSDEEKIMSSPVSTSLSESTRAISLPQTSSKVTPYELSKQLAERPKSEFVPAMTLSQTSSQVSPRVLSKQEAERPKSEFVPAMTLSQTSSHISPRVLSKQEAERPKSEFVTAMTLSQISRHVNHPELSEQLTEKPRSEFVPDITLSQTANEVSPRELSKRAWRPKSAFVPAMTLSKTSSQVSPPELSKQPTEKPKSEFVPATTLSQTPSQVSHPELSKQQAERSESELVPAMTLAETSSQVSPPELSKPRAWRPKSIDFKLAKRATILPRPSQMSKEEDGFLTQQKEEPVQSFVSETRGILQSRSSSSSSSLEDVKTEEHIFQYEQAQINPDSSFDSPDIFPTSPNSTMSRVDITSPPPTIIITPATSRARESHYVNVVANRSGVVAATLEGVPVIRTPDQRPFISPVMENHAASDLESFFAEQHVHDPSWKTRSSESVNETDLNSSFENEVVGSRHTPTKVEAKTVNKRSWVPKQKKTRRTMTLVDYENTEQEQIYQPVSGIQTGFEGEKLGDKVLHPRLVSDNYEDSLESGGLKSVDNQSSNYRSPISFPQDDIPETNDRYFDRSFDSYSSRSVDTSRDLSRDYLYNTKALERKPSIESNPSFTRNLDRVLDQYSSLDIQHSNFKNQEYIEIPTPTNEPSSSNKSSKLRGFTSKENDEKSAVKKKDFYSDLERIDTIAYDNEHKYNRPDTGYDRKLSDYETSDRYYDRKGHKTDISDIEEDRTEMDYISERDYDRQDHKYNRSDIGENRNESDYVSDSDYDRKDHKYDRSDVEGDRKEINYISDRDFVLTRQQFDRPDFGYAKNEKDGDYDVSDKNDRNKDYGERDSVSYTSKDVPHPLDTARSGREEVFAKPDQSLQKHHDWTPGEDSMHSIDSNRNRQHDDDRDGSYTGTRRRDSNTSNDSNRTSAYHEKTSVPKTSVSSGRTWQPKPRRSRGFDSSPPKRVISTKDSNTITPDPSVDSNGTSSTSPYKYKVAGSAFNSAKPDVVGGLITPPPDRRAVSLGSLSSLAAETSRSLKETPV